MVADSIFRQGVPYDAVGLDKYSTSLLAALDIKESKQRYRGGVGLIIAEASHLITIEPSWTTAREEKVTEHAYDSRSSQLEYIKFYMGLSLLLSALAAPEQKEGVELPDLGETNDRIMKRINAD
ncbi:uncharacterized protein FFB20_10033 [Fusarium fujikuroi]|nr:uncharacterized protein FFE2_03896 [Fusarium fujikuroi]SCN79911.1 uncharacterized protein FFM5_02230 [Fusarium fujikuroi]SCN95609.1 uncharacterized protein FFB20_10033 [Fusarium fujikuroi]SCN96068.1 uncharacterized protein FFC1_07479 [Fusarium fujikuroi]SCO39124.1 uncharacterized protein FFNC_06479 [Fusarium fujikuroi]